MGYSEGRSEYKPQWIEATDRECHGMEYREQEG